MQALIPPDQIPMWIRGPMTLSSDHLDWGGMLLKGYSYAGQEAAIPTMRDYMIVVYKGGLSDMRRRTCGPWESGRVGPGVVSLLTRGEKSQWQWNNPLNVQHLYLTHSVIENIAAEVFDRDIQNIEIDDLLCAEDDTLPVLAGLLENELRGAGVGERLYADTLRTQVGVHVLRRYAKVNFVSRAAGGLTESQRRAIIDYVEAHLSRSIALCELAALLGMSSFHFSRKFRADFGIPPHSFVMEQRIKRAKAMLRKGTTPLKIIAADCGFSDQSHMNRLFRRATGVTPTEFQRSI